jgi:hypothetical protein
MGIEAIFGAHCYNNVNGCYYAHTSDIESQYHNIVAFVLV